MDIIFFALVAGVIFYKLYNELGRTDDDIISPSNRANINLEKRIIDVLSEDIIEGEITKKYSPEIASGLLSISALDKTFSENHFMKGAKAAFELILISFSKGNKEPLKNLLSEEVYKNFEQAIDSRESLNRYFDTTLVSIKNANIISAQLHELFAFIEVKFISEQINIIRDKDGNIIEGDVHHIITHTDIWKFKRHVTSRDPVWKLVATGN